MKERLLRHANGGIFGIFHLDLQQLLLLLGCCKNEEQTLWFGSIFLLIASISDVVPLQLS